MSEDSTGRHHPGIASSPFNQQGDEHPCQLSTADEGPSPAKRAMETGSATHEHEGNNQETQKQAARSDIRRIALLPSGVMVEVLPDVNLPKLPNSRFARSLIVMVVLCVLGLITWQIFAAATLSKKSLVPPNDLTDTNRVSCDLDSFPNASSVSVMGFFERCNGHEVIGFFGAAPGQKCCVMRYQLHCSSLVAARTFVIPDVGIDTRLLNQSQIQDLLDCCPSLSGKTIPVGFSNMGIAAAVGAVVTVILNVLQLAPCVTMLKDCSQGCCRGCCNSSETVPMPDDEQRPVIVDSSEWKYIGVGNIIDSFVECDESQRSFLLSLFFPGSFATVKCVAVMSVGVIGAIVNASQYSSSHWENFAYLIALLANGSALQSFVDYLSAVCVTVTFVYRDYLEFFWQVDASGERTHAALWTALQLGFVPGLALATGLVFFVPGWILFFMPMLVILLSATVLCMIAAFLFAQVSILSLKSRVLKELPYRRHVHFVYSVLLMLVVNAGYNFCLGIAFRLPVNMMLVGFGLAEFPYQQTAFNDASFIEVPYFTIQMASPTCQLLKTTLSAWRMSELVLLIL